ncbi:acid-responsive two-component system response regulator TcrA [Spirochaetota bacterium]
MPNKSARRCLTVLIAEDDDGHAELIQSQLEDAGVKNKMERFRDGLELWNFLDSNGRKDQAYLILLDLRMPKMDGLDVLKRIKSDPLLSLIPVIMLTTTDDPKEIEDCYRLGCNCYVTKPVEFSAFAETLNRLGLFLLIMSISDVPMRAAS